MGLLFAFQFTYQAKKAQFDPLVVFWIALANYGFLRFLLRTRGDPQPDWKFWLLGFLADFIGALFLFGCWYLSLLPEPVGSWIDSIISQAFLNPFRTLPGFLYTLTGVVIAGVCIYFFDKRAMKSCTLLDGRQRHIVALTMAVVTAPWTFLIPLYNY